MTPFPRLAGVALVAGLSLGAAAPALAQEDEATEQSQEHTPIDHIRDHCDHAIERRLDDLATAQNRLDGIEILTDTHEATIDGIIDATESGLTALRADLAAATERAEILRLCARIAADFRVYLVVLPQAHLTVGADRVDGAVATADELVARFDEAVAAAEAAGADVADAVAHRDAAVGHVRTADAAASGVADSVLAVTPESFNDGPGAATLDEARRSLHTSHQELREAHADAHAAVRALRDAQSELESV